MANTGLINEAELRKAIEQLHPNGELFEVRIIPSKGKPASGYFKDADALIKAFDRYDLRNANVYMTLQCVNDALFSRQQHEHFIAGANATSDSDVEGYTWLFIDLDPERPAGISSTDDELKKAFGLARRIVAFMKDIGFENPVKAISGNGAHLLYRIEVKRNEETSDLIERCLKALSMLFDTDDVKVDTSTFNPSRVCKLYGTMAQKGTSTEERPFRMSRITEDLKPVRITNIEYVKKIADMLPAETRPQPASKYNGYNPNTFDIEEWMSKHGLTHKGAKVYKGGVKYVLDYCPFNHDHKAPDSMITKSESGAIGFKCLHNSCSGKHWQDVRLMFEPDAYSYTDTDERIERGFAKHNREREKAQTVNDDVPAFETVRDILNRNDPDPEYIQTGINIVDKKILGLEKGKVSVLSGLRASAKSTILGQIILNAVDADHSVVCYSGELSDKSFVNWIMLQAAGSTNVEASARYEECWYVRKEYEEVIADWLGEKLWLWNNVKNADLDNMVSMIEQKAVNASADLIVIDNLMALDVGSRNRSNEYEAQTRFVWQLKDIATRTNTHIILVAHPRKTQGYLRIEDISGTGNIGNIADNCFIIHRVNKDFTTRAPEHMGKIDFDILMKSKCTNVLEIAKERNRGMCDEYVPLYFEASSKRLKNFKDENHNYGWHNAFDDAVPDEIPF